MRPSRSQLVRLWLAFFSFGSTAFATDPPVLNNVNSDIVPDETGVNAGPVAAHRPTVQFVAAQRTHDAGEYAQAAAEWFQIAQGTTTDDPLHREIAEYQLGLALRHLGLYHASLRWLSIAATHPRHVMHGPTLSQLGTLSDVLVERRELVAHLANYSLSDLEQVTLFTTPETTTTLAYLLGRSHYEQGEFSTALRAFARVDVTSPHFLQARLFESACHVRQRHSVPALLSLSRAVSALESGTVHVRERQRWLDLLNLSQARIYYSAGIRLDAETNVPLTDAKRLSAAVKFYDKLEPTSEYYVEAAFELAWLYFMIGEHSRVLGKIHTLDSPYFTDAVPPESSFLRTVVYWSNCNYEAAGIVTARFNKRYLPLRDSLKSFIRRHQASLPVPLVEAFEKVQRETTPEAHAIAPFFSTLRRHREFLRARRAIETVSVETSRFLQLPATFKATELGRQLQSDLEGERRSAARRADEWLRAAITHRIDEIDEQTRNGEKLHIVFADVLRNLLDVRLRSGQVSHADSAIFGAVRADEEHLLWPFDGEYWLDEIGTYRAAIYSTCGR